MRTSLLIGSSLCLVAGVWSCDALWSSSVVDCGRSGFKCPEGYTPPGQDLSMNDSDGGTGSEDGGGSPGSDGSVTGDMANPSGPAYTSIYILGDNTRRTYLGTADGNIQQYVDIGGVPSKSGGLMPYDSGSAIVGIWRGDVVTQLSGITHSALLVASNNKKIFLYVNGVNLTTEKLDTEYPINSMWVGAWNAVTTSLSTMQSITILTAGDSSELRTGQLVDNGMLGNSKLKIDWTVIANLPGQPNLRSVTGLARIDRYDAMVRCSTTRDPMCDNGAAWAVGQMGQIHYYRSPGVSQIFSWAPIAGVSGMITASDLDAVGVSPMTGRITAMGQQNTMLERQTHSASWMNADPSPIMASIRAITYCDENEAYAVGDSAKVYRWLSSDMQWKPLSITIAGKPFSGSDFKAVHCLPPGTSTMGRIGIVGTNRTYVFANIQADGNRTLSPWQLVL